MSRYRDHKDACQVFEKIENNEENLPFEMDIIRLIYSDTYKIADPCPDAYAERVAKAFLRKGAYLLKNEKMRQMMEQNIAEFNNENANRAIFHAISELIKR